MKIKDVQTALEQISEEKIVQLVEIVEAHDKIIIIGNGGSNAIASHISQDYTKRLHKRCVSFSDPSRLTCYINDYGMEMAYSHFICEFADPDTLVILISSSGNSPNIISAATTCKVNDWSFITLTGFESENNVNRTFSESAALQFWVDSTDYGVVECTHQIILHTPA